MRTATTITALLMPVLLFGCTGPEELTQGEMRARLNTERVAASFREYETRRYLKHARERISLIEERIQKLRSETSAESKALEKLETKLDLTKANLSALQLVSTVDWDEQQVKLEAWISALIADVASAEESNLTVENK